MSFSQLTMPDGYPHPADITNENFVQTKIISPDREALHHRLPAYLLKFAHQDSWDSITVEEVVQNKIQKPIQNLYLDQILLKSHDPNQVFDIIRKNVSAGNYVAFRIITAENIKHTIQKRLSATVFPFYYPFHFLSRRVLPKLKGCRKICRLLTIPVDVSKAEILGRLIYKGFQIVDVVETGQETVIITQGDVGNPSESKPASNEGFLFKMQRMGKDGKPITVYKFRSMHPYAEYVQDYVHKTNGLDVGGKFKNDFRVSTGGRILRKYWLDELPMLYNLLKGDLKLIGVRPLSEHYFNLYPAHLQVLRRKHKPGLLPPFYADMPVGFDNIVQSEWNYLQAFEQNPFKTDAAYLLKILKNIVVNKARSK